MKVHKMAKAAGADVVAAADVGALSQEDWAEMVTRCRACTWEQGCVRFLAQGGKEGPVDVPVDCVNRDQLNALAALKSGET
ncbi:DUF6455 family protein [Shimia haliotis]|nr:DUF6455 family protein [Shimia haliotis]